MHRRYCYFTPPLPEGGGVPDTVSGGGVGVWCAAGLPPLSEETKEGIVDGGGWRPPERSC